MYFPAHREWVFVLVGLVGCCRQNEITQSKHFAIMYFNRTALYTRKTSRLVSQHFVVAILKIAIHSPKQ